jgi:hypothetical protein
MAIAAITPKTRQKIRQEKIRDEQTTPASCEIETFYLFLRSTGATVDRISPIHARAGKQA